MTLYRRNHRNLLICLIAFIPMACAAGPLADRESREVSDFNRIEVSGLVNVKIQQGNKVGIDVRAYGIAMQDIITTVKDETLLVTTEGSHRGESIAINVTYTKLLAIKTSGAATIETKGVLKGESIKIKITEAGDANLALDVNRLNIVMQGAGNLRLTGNATSQFLISHGGGGSLDNSGLKIASQ